MDYGHELEFGYFLIPDAGNPRRVLEAARLADLLGYDVLAVQDHPYQPLMGDPDPATLRTFIDDVAPRVRERVATTRALDRAAGERRATRA